MSQVFPIGLLLEGRACLVVGSKASVLSRVTELLAAGAKVHVVNPDPDPQVQALAQQNTIQLFTRPFIPKDMCGKWLAVLVDTDSTLAEQMATAAEQERVFFCAVDQPKLNSYSHLAIARVGLLTLAIGSDGKAPALSRRLRQELERLLHESNLEQFAEELAELRQHTPSAQRAAVLGAKVQGLHLTGKIVIPEE